MGRWIKKKINKNIASTPIEIYISKRQYWLYIIWETSIARLKIERCHNFWA